MRESVSIMRIETERLILLPMTLAFVEGILDDDHSVYEAIGLNYNSLWPNEDTMEILPIIRNKMISGAVNEGYGIWLFVDKNRKVVLGDGGFKQKPNESGMVEIGYGVIEGERRKGFAFEALSALLGWALQKTEVKTVTANCLIGNSASHNLLLKLDMIETKRDDQLINFEKK